jgi:hypothetical protein
VGEVLKAYLEMERLPGEPMPEGLYLVHNHVKPVSPLGINGFRAWIQLHKRDLVECRCNFGNVKNARLHRPHYRVKAALG